MTTPQTRSGGGTPGQTPHYLSYVPQLGAESLSLGLH